MSCSEGWLRVDQAARRLNVMPRTVRYHVVRGALVAEKRGPKIWMIVESSVDALKRKLKQRSEDAHA